MCRARSARVSASTSLIPQTLEEMAVDTDHQKLQASLKRRGQAALTREEKRKRQRSLEAIDAPSFTSLCQVTCQDSQYIPPTKSSCCCSQLSRGGEDMGCSPLPKVCMLRGGAASIRSQLERLVQDVLKHFRAAGKAVQEASHCQIANRKRCYTQRYQASNHSHAYQR